MEPRSLLVTRHDLSTFPKIGIDSKNAIVLIPIFGTGSKLKISFKLEKEFGEFEKDERAQVVT